MSCKYLVHLKYVDCAYENVLCLFLSITVFIIVPSHKLLIFSWQGNPLNTGSSNDHMVVGTDRYFPLYKVWLKRKQKHFRIVLKFAWKSLLRFIKNKTYTKKDWNIITSATMSVLLPISNFAKEKKQKYLFTAFWAHF